MAKCNFSIEFTGSAEDLVAKARQAVEEAGGHFSGDGSSGSFSAPVPGGKIAGSYTVSGQTINFIIDSKPFFIPCSLIESKLREWLGQTAELAPETVSLEEAVAAPACQFGIDFTGSAGDLVAKARRAIEEAGGSFSGNAESGSFSAPVPGGKIKGSYTVSGQTINIIIDSKPWIIPCKLIESKLREWLGQTSELALEGVSLEAVAAPACQFSIDFTGSAGDLVVRARTAIEDAGGSFTGNTSSGAFSVPTPVGKISGSYTISGQTIDIVIDSKPWIVPCSTIESKLKDYLTG